MFSRRAFLGASLASLSLSACDNRPTGVIRVGYLPISESLPIFMAQANGAFEREGVQVEAVALDGGARILEAMISGDLHFGLTNYVSLMLARESGMDFKLVAGSTVESANNPQHALMVRQDSTLTVEGLAGKRIAVNTRRNINELFVRARLAQAGVDPESVTLVEVPFPRMLAALESNSVDAAGCIEPFVSFAKRSNVAKPIAQHVVDVAPDVPIAGWVASNSYVQNPRSGAQAFIAAVTSAAAAITADPVAARALLPTFTRLTVEDAEAVPLPTFVSDTPPAQLPALLTRVREAGWITDAADSIEDYLLPQ